MTDLDILASGWQSLERRMNLLGHLRPRLGAEVVVALAPIGETRTMTRALRCHRSYHYACRTQHTHWRPAHPDGAVDGVCERSVWCFEQQQVSRHTSTAGCARRRTTRRAAGRGSSGT